MKKTEIRKLVVGGFSTNCWICPLAERGDALAPPGAPSPCAVIDPGEEGERVVAFLDDHNLFPALVLLTHGHFDHLAALPHIDAEYRRRGGAAPEIAVHAADARYLGAGAFREHCLTLGLSGGGSPFAESLRSGVPPPDRLLSEGDRVGPFVALHLPGHTPGSVAFWHEGAGVLFSGDTLFRGGYGRSDLPGGDGLLLAASLRRLFEMDGDAAVFPGHGGSTTIGRERRGLAL